MIDTHTDRHTHTQTRATTKPEGQNWSRVKKKTMNVIPFNCWLLKMVKSPNAEILDFWHSRCYWRQWSRLWNVVLTLLWKCRILLRMSVFFSQRMTHNSHRPTTMYMTGDGCALKMSAKHEDGIKWKHFPRYWSFVRGIHWSPVNNPHKGQSLWHFLWSALELPHPNPHVITPLYPQKWMLSHHRHFDRFQVIHYNKVVHRDIA